MLDRSLKLRDYQDENAGKWLMILQEYNIVYLAFEPRTWKSITSMEIAKRYWAKKILFLTKKKAIKSIESDSKYFDMNIIITNYENLHNIKDNDFDLLILDEAHQLWTFPKPNNKVKDIKKRFSKLPMILLSWTPASESYSSFYHQFFVSINSPWKKYINFYRWVNNEYVKIKIVYTSYWESKNYSNWNYTKIMNDISHLILTYTQKEAGFETSVKEEVLYVDMLPKTYQIVDLITKNRVIELKEEVVLADTWVKLMQKLHQIYSWTVKFESWNTRIFDNSKAIFIKKHFEWKRIWIFYKFQAEKELLKQVFLDDITDDLEEFKTSEKNIMLQIISWREWISLKEADFLVFFNIDFSAISYFQAKDRLTTIDRKENTIYWIFSRNWIEEKIYETVKKKKNFTLNIFKNVGIMNTK